MQSMKIYKHAATGLLLGGLCLLPSAAWAGGCDCGAIQSMINRSQGIINANTSAEAAGIRTEITLAAQNIIGTIKVSSASIVRAIIDLKESNAAAIKGLLAAKEAVETGDLYGATAQPGSLCGSSAVGAGVQVGAQAATDVRRDMRGKQIDYSSNPDARPLDYLERQLAEDHPDVKQMVEGMFPLDRTLTAEQLAQAHEAIKTLADPRPLPMPTDDQKENTAAGQTYAAARLVHQGRIQTAREALDHHVAFHAPTLPPEVAQWAVEQWKQAGAQGTPPGVVDGKISEAALLNLLVQARAGNPNWYTQIASATEAGLLRELVLMQSVQLQLQHRNMEYLDRLSVVTSLDYLTRMEGTTGKEMEALYRQMIGTQQ